MNLYENIKKNLKESDEFDELFWKNNLTLDKYRVEVTTEDNKKVVKFYTYDNNTYKPEDIINSSYFIASYYLDTLLEENNTNGLNLGNNYIISDMDWQEVLDFLNYHKNNINETEKPSNQPAYVICYGQLEIWPNVESAKSFYREGMDMCEGSEQERYMNIVYSLGHGNFFADDLGPEKVTSIVDRDENGNIKTERVHSGAMTHEQAIDYITRLQNMVQNMSIKEAESTTNGLKMPQDDEWITGEVTINNKKYYVQGKVYEEPSSYGINDSQVSKLWVHEMKGNDLEKEIIAYDRGWDKEPKGAKDKKVLQEVLKLLIDFRSKNHYLDDWELNESEETTIKLTKDTRDQVEVGDILADSTNRYVVVDIINNPRSKQITVRDEKDWRPIFGDPISNWYGTKIIKGPFIRKDGKVIKEAEKSWEDKCKYIFNKYRDEFDTINEVRDISDYLNKLYSEQGIQVVNDWFLPGASEEYKKDFKSLINKK